MPRLETQKEFDLTIGRLDRVLSKLVRWGRHWKRRIEIVTSDEDQKWPAELDLIDEANAQTLKHHAEDMIAAGQKILKDLGHSVPSTPQPE